MSVPSSVEELIQLIRKSGMVDEQKLTTYLHRRQAGRGLPHDPREATDAMVADGILTNFQAEQFLLGKWRGFTIGKYKLLERIGVGGMGQVFLCEHMYMRRRVAIKVLPPAKAEQPAALGRFYREARAAGSLEHPNIVRTHDIDQDGNLHFIVMEHVDGTNLLDAVKKFGPMNMDRAVSYIYQVATGLDFAFTNGIIHRDIKPGNILIDRRGTAKLLDMGLARFYKDQTDMLTVKYDDKIVLGTADYVAPEQVANSHSVDVRADIYALGASLYFLLAGHPPFPNGTVSQKLLWHRTKDPTPIKQIRSEVPEGLATIVKMMMMKEPNQRFQTPKEVADALFEWLPSDVPLPSEEEMPKLSIAALDEQQSTGASKLPNPTASQSLRDIMASVKSVPISELRKAAVSTGVAQASKPIPTPARRDDTPEPLRASKAASPSVAAPFAPASSEPTGGSKLHRLSHQPMPGIGLPPLPAMPLMDRPGKLKSGTGSQQALNTRGVPASQPIPYPTDFPIIAMPPTDQGLEIRRVVFFSLVGASVILGILLLAYKFVWSPTPALPPSSSPAVQVSTPAE